MDKNAQPSEQDTFDSLGNVARKDAVAWACSRLPNAALVLEESQLPCERCRMLMSTIARSLYGRESHQEIDPAQLGELDPSCRSCKLLGNSPPYESCWLLPLGRRHGTYSVSINLECQGHNPKTSGHPGAWKISVRQNPFQIPHEWSPAWPAYPFPSNLYPFATLLECCVASHKNECGQNDRKMVDGLRLINCGSRLIEDATSTSKYVALSYAWGAKESLAAASVSKAVGEGMLPPTVERTIEDAMTVTRKLGLFFLWVDRYCIDQTSTHKHTQIRQMDAIYQNAELTIIASAGDGPSYGLPGVSTARIQQQVCRVGNYLLFDPFFEPQEAIMSRSKWAARAWTYQESRFSRRRLIFTDQEISFSCCVIDTQSGSERNFLGPTGTNDTPAKRDSRSLNHRHDNGPFAGNIHAQIHEYSKRKLTYSSDAINAFAGVLRAYENGNFPLYNVWAVPVLGPIDSLPLSMQNALRQYEMRDTSIEGLLSGLLWELEQPALRRADFPSWSWVGWSGTVANISSLPRRCPEPATGEPDVTVEVELKTDQLLPWDEFEKRHFFKETPYRLLSHFLWINAWTIPVRLEVGHTFGEICRHWLGRCEDEIGMSWSFSHITLTDGSFGTLPVNERRDLIGVFLEGPYQRYGALLLVQVGGFTARRVGTLYYTDRAPRNTGESIHMRRRKLRIG